MTIKRITINGATTKTFHADSDAPGVQNHQSADDAKSYADSVKEANPAVEIVDETPKPEEKAAA